ncbi:hypothetical protein MLD38_032243 [Melastoma candidum]|uniref:Uncharacterized protein n=1 Tax=Melastoma candidum TaxID=119954 RepID=A0ACB9M313_9MYRT|nr:hypothetical protein MLD38_032243 [Melastoma candidum]
MIVRNSPAVEEPPPSVDRPSSSSSGHVKSEFFEALSSGENEAKAFHSKFEEFSDRLEKTDTRLFLLTKFQYFDGLPARFSVTRLGCSCTS